MLDRKYEKFTGGPALQNGKATEPRITINRKGLIYLNRKAHEALGRPKAVALYFCREDDTIAVEPAYPRFAQNFPVTGKQNGWSIRAASFCAHFRIRPEGTQRFIYPDFNSEGALLLNLSQTVTVGGRIMKPKNRAGEAA